MSLFVRAALRSSLRSSRIRLRPLSTLYAPTHEYVKVEGDIGVIGITDHAAGALGDIVYVELPQLGTKVAVGDSFGSVESVKAASDVYAPLSGEVIAVNSALEGEPGIVNQSPFEDGWFIKIKLGATAKAEVSKLLDEAKYAKLKESEAH